MKKFIEFEKNKLSQNSLRQLYGGDCKTGTDHCSDTSDNNGKTTYDDKTYSTGDQCPGLVASTGVSTTFIERS